MEFMEELENLGVNVKKGAERRVGRPGIIWGSAVDSN